MRAKRSRRCSTRSRSRCRRSTSAVKGMSGGQRQCLAIARALLWGRRIVILDEPTAALGVRETEQVLEVIRDLRKHDVSVIVVSHNMQQLMTVADRITVMRLGRTIATRTVKDTQVSEIVGLITGAIGADADTRMPAYVIRPESRHQDRPASDRHCRTSRPKGGISCCVAYSAGVAVGVRSRWSVLDRRRVGPGQVQARHGRRRQHLLRVDEGPGRRRPGPRREERLGLCRAQQQQRSGDGAEERADLRPGRRRRRHPVQRPALGRTRRSARS